jgi:cytochrome c oxidase accessory protein FixG
MIITGLLFLNFTFFRERLCFFVCPYGRFQNALIDANSVTVYYDKIRGEPRGKLTANVDGGDCVDCKRCVRVCPTNIDIRNGLQLECIACARCVDACDEVMKKLSRPAGLIRYQTGNQKPVNFKRFRLLLYEMLFLIFLVAFISSLVFRHQVDFVILRQSKNPFTMREEVVNNKVIRILQNQFQVHLKNQGNNIQSGSLSLSEKNRSAGFRILSPATTFALSKEQDLKLPVFIEIDESVFNQTDPDIEFKLKTESESIVRKIKFVMSITWN